MGRVFRKDSVIPADGNGLMFMPMDQSLYEDSYRFMMREILDQQIDYLETQYDDVYLNLEAGNNDTTIEMLDRAEVVVVCLPANSESFDEFYDRYRSMIGKCFFVFFGHGGMTEPLQTRFLQYLPTHVTRSCYVEMTRLLRNYLSDGRGLDYLDMLYLRLAKADSGRDFYGTRRTDASESDVTLADVAEKAEEYRASFSGEPETRYPGEDAYLKAVRRGGIFLTDPYDEYVKWKNETDRRIGQDANSAAEYGMRNCGETERNTFFAIQYICDWLIRYEHRGIGNDCATIAEHMLRRRYIPREVIEWKSRDHSEETR